MSCIYLLPPLCKSRSQLGRQKETKKDRLTRLVQCSAVQVVCGLFACLFQMWLTNASPARSRNFVLDSRPSGVGPGRGQHPCLFSFFFDLLLLPAIAFPPPRRFESRSLGRCWRRAAAHSNTGANTHSTEWRSARSPKNTTPSRGRWRWRGAEGTSSLVTGARLSLSGGPRCSSLHLDCSATSLASRHESRFPPHSEWTKTAEEERKKKKKTTPANFLWGWLKQRRDWPQAVSAAVDEESSPSSGWNCKLQLYGFS